MASAQFPRFSPISLWRGAWWHGDRYGAIPKSALPWLRGKSKSTKRHIEGSLNKRAQCLLPQWNASSNKAMTPKAATPFGVHFFFPQTITPWKEHSFKNFSSGSLSLFSASITCMFKRSFLFSIYSNMKTYYSEAMKDRINYSIRTSETKQAFLAVNDKSKKTWKVILSAINNWILNSCSRIWVYHQNKESKDLETRITTILKSSQRTPFVCSSTPMSFIS